MLIFVFWGAGEAFLEFDVLFALKSDISEPAADGGGRVEGCCVAAGLGSSMEMLEASGRGGAGR